MEDRLSLFIVHLVSRNDKRGLSHNDGNVLTEANALGNAHRYYDYVVGYLQMQCKDELRNSNELVNANLGRGDRKKTTKLYQAGRNFLFESNGNCEFPLRVDLCDQLCISDSWHIIVTSLFHMLRVIEPFKANFYYLF